MAKKFFVTPKILKSSWGGEGGEVGPGSGGSSDDLTMVNYEEWFEMYGDFFDDDDDIDFDDYRIWWTSNNLSQEAWELINPGVSITPGDPFPNP